MSGKRSFWPDPIDATATEHTHRLPKALRLILVALVVCVLALALAVGFLLTYILDVREYRNQQLDVIREQIRIGQCDQLDQLPEGGLLDRPRAKYRCGPGIPLESYPPDVRRDLERRPTSPPPPADEQWPATGSPPQTSEEP